MSESTNYPDLEADTLGDLKKIIRLPRMQKIAPDIRWGAEYQSWPVEQRLSYAEKLASSMNHAADVLQQERNELLVILRRKEEQLKHSSKQYLSQGETMHRELGAQDAEKQVLYLEIVRLKAQIKIAVRGFKAAQEALSGD